MAMVTVTTVMIVVVMTVLTVVMIMMMMKAIVFGLEMVMTGLYRGGSDAGCRGCDGIYDEGVGAASKDVSCTQQRR